MGPIKTISDRTYHEEIIAKYGSVSVFQNAIKLKPTGY